MTGRGIVALNIDVRYITTALNTLPLLSPGNSHVMASALESCVVGNGKCVIIGLDEEGSKIQVDQMQMLLGKTMTGTGFGGLLPGQNGHDNSRL